jgi:glycosyltransferase involved in cell wall biosynthesis
MQVEIAALARSSYQSGGIVKLPLASIIVTNHDYAAYVAACIQSALDQTYSNIEIVIVDDASTDDSIEVIEGFIKNRPSCRLIRRTVNGGQGAAMLDGLRASSGDFICFLDADDILFPNFTSAHVFVHLALRQQVAFTSSDLVHINSCGRVLTGSSGVIRNIFLSDSPDSDIALPELAIADNIDALLNPQREAIRRCIHVPNARLGYHWSSCSGLVFKRAALEMLSFDDVLLQMRISADFYLTLCHFISGSAVIDSKLGAYRIHGRNGYAAQPFLDGIDTSCGAPNNRYLFIDALKATAAMITGPRLEHFWKLLGGEWLFPPFVTNLQKYCETLNSDGVDVRFFAHGLAASIGKLTALSNENFAVHLLRDRLGLSEDELIRYGILKPPPPPLPKARESYLRRFLKALVSPRLALHYARRLVWRLAPSKS